MYYGKQWSAEAGHICRWYRPVDVEIKPVHFGLLQRTSCLSAAPDDYAWDVDIIISTEAMCLGVLLADLCIACPTPVWQELFCERELTFMFAICRRPSVCLSSVCTLYVCLSSVTFVRRTQGIEIFGNVFTPFGTLAICDFSIKKFTEIVPGGTPLSEGIKPKRDSQI